MGASDHGTTKSLYARDPDGLEFEVVWLIPAHLMTAADRAGDSRPKPLDLAREVERFGADTRGGLGVSVPLGVAPSDRQGPLRLRRAGATSAAHSGQGVSPAPALTGQGRVCPPTRAPHRALRVRSVPGTTCRSGPRGRPRPVGRPRAARRSSMPTSVPPPRCGPVKRR